MKYFHKQEQLDYTVKRASQSYNRQMDNVELGFVCYLKIWPRSSSDNGAREKTL